MARNKHNHATHFSTTHKLLRSGKTIRQTVPQKERKGWNAQAPEKQEFKSINMAKRFMLRGHLEA